MRVPTITANLLYLLVNTQIYIALGAVCIAYASTVIFSVPFDFKLALFVFAPTFAIYNLNRKTDLDEDRVNTPHRIAFIQKHTYLPYLAFVIYLGALVLAAYTNIKILGVLLFYMIIGIIYSYAFLPGIVRRLGYTRLKEIPLVKNFVVALDWALIPLVVAIYCNITAVSAVIYIIVYIFLRLFLGCVAFDIRDMRGDEKEGIRTLPILLGIPKTRAVLHALNVISAVYLLSLVVLGYLPFKASLLALTALYAIYPLYRLGKTGSNDIFLCEVVIDGEYLFIGALAWISTLAF